MNLKIEPSNKRFYHRYDYRVKTKYSIPHINNDFPLKAVSGSDNGKDILNFYFNDLENVQKFIDHYGDKILKVEGPINTFHSVLLMRPDIDIKKTLYYNKYRYKVRFGFQDNSVAKENNTVMALRNLVKNNKEDFLGTHLYEGIQWSWTMPVIYTKDKQALMMLKLATSVKHKDIIKAITIKEIEKNGQAYSKEVD